MLNKKITKRCNKYYFRNKKAIIVILLIIILIGFIIHMCLLLSNHYISIISLACDIIITITSILGAIGIVSSLHKDRALEEAQFIVNLSNSFVQNPDYYIVYDFWNKYHDKKAFKNMSKKDKKKLPQIISLTYKYLDFFEPLYFLVEKNIIEISTVDELFEYRFCMIVNNWGVQHYVLNPRNKRYLEEGYYDNIIRLYMHIRKYRYSDKGLKYSFGLIHMPIEDNDLWEYAIKCKRFKNIE